MKTYKFILGFIFILFMQNCILRRNTRLTWEASQYLYNPCSKDSMYFKSFKDFDSSYLTKDTSIKYVLTVDSLVIYEGNNIRKYYSDYFEIYKYEIPSKYLYVSRFLYSNEMVFEKCYYNNELEYEKENINGIIYLKNVRINTKW